MATANSSIDAGWTQLPVKLPRLTACDDLCALLLAALTVDTVFAFLAQGADLCVVGAAGCQFSSVPSTLRALWVNGGFVELHHLGTTPLTQNHPLANGQLDRWQSVLMLPFYDKGRPIGFGGMANRSDKGPFTPKERQALFHVCGIMQARLVAESALRHAGSTLLKSLEDLRK